MNKETFHKLNRIALLSMLCLSVIIPFISVTISEENTTEVHQAILDWEQLIIPDTAEITRATPATWVGVVLLVYVIGIIFFAGRNIYSLIRMLALFGSGKAVPLGKGIKLITHNKDIAPFSWMKYIVISEKDLAENKREILLHEMAHIKKKHSVDLLLIDACIFFQWFNPAAWLMKQELQNIHEYEADETVIKEGINTKQYQLLLIKKAVGKRLYSMANSFNHSKLKKRITMMSKQKSKSRTCLKYLYILPVAALSIAVFARPEVSNQLEEFSNVKINDLAEIVKIKAENNPEVLYVINLEDSLQDKKAKAVVVVSGTNENVPETVHLSLNGDTLKQGKEPLIIIDGKEASGNLLNALKATSIKSINVLKDASATEEYGEKGKNGVILITLKDENDKDTVAGNTGIVINKRVITTRGNVVTLTVDSIIKSRVINLDSLETKGKVSRLIKIDAKAGDASKHLADSVVNVYMTMSDKTALRKDSVIELNGKTYKTIIVKRKRTEESENLKQNQKD